MDIEKIAVATVILEVGKYPQLQSHINTGDKEPIWDGHICVYKEGSKNNTNKDFIGRISVQVKGKKVKKLSNGNSKYRIAVEYLKAYQKEKSGTLLLVVEIVSPEETKLFYTNLLPVDLNNILKKVKVNQKTVTIDINPIKEKSTPSLKMVCRYFLKNSQLQICSKIKSIEEIKNIKEITCPLIAQEQLEISYLFNNDFYYYVQVKENDDLYVLDVVGPIRTAITNKKASIRVKDKEYYKTIEIKKTKDDENIKFGKSTQMSTKTNKINYKITGNIYERIRDVEFIIKLLKNKEFTINNKLITLVDSEYEQDIIKFEKELIALNKMRNILEKFNIIFDNDLEQLDRKSIDNLCLLIQLNDGVLHKDVKEMQVYVIEIADISIAFFITVDSKKKVHLNNYFGDLEDKMIVHCVYKDNSIRISPYINLTEKELTTCSNVNVDIMRKSFDKYEPKNEGMCEKYILFMLELIKVYDKTGDLKWLEFAKYINDKNKKFSQQPIYKMNEIQMIKRRRKLALKEKEELYEIRETQRENVMIQCAIAILLDNQSDYERYFNMLDDESKEIFKQFPIYNIAPRSSDI